MKKLIKIILMLILAIAVFAGGIIAFYVSRVDQGMIKNEIARVVHDKTGGKLTINGSIQWTLFPWFGLKLHDVVLENITGLSTGKFAKAGEVGFSVELLPLIKNAFNLANITIADVSIENGQIFWQKQQTNKKIEINKLNLHCKNINFNKPFDVKTDFYLQNPGSILNGQVNANASIKLDVVNKLYVLNNLQVNGKLADKPIDFSAKTNVTIDLKKQTLVSEDFKLQIANTVATGSLRGNNILDTPKLNLKLVLNNVEVRPLLVNVAEYDKFSGALTLNTNITMHGATGEAMLGSLSGSGSVLITNGSYRGIDVPYQVRRASAIINQKAMPQETQPSHTDFDRLTASFQISNSWLNTNDLLIQAPDYKVTGQGGANIVSEQLDLRLNAYSTHDDNFFVPIKVTGSFTNSSIKPDMAVLLKKMVVKEIGKQLQKLNVPQKILDALPLDKLFH